MIHKHFKTKAKFNEEYAASRIADSDICFIKDTGEIWTHGVFYAKVEASTTNGNIKINGTETTVYTHPSGTNPHGTTKSDVGLGSVVNTGDSATPVSGGTTKFTTGGAYTELAKKVDKVSGKGLSTNDYTTDEKNKLAGVEAGAQVHIAPTTAEVKSALGTGTNDGTFLRKDGTWAEPVALTTAEIDALWAAAS